MVSEMVPNDFGKAVLCAVTVTTLAAGATAGAW